MADAQRGEEKLTLAFNIKSWINVQEQIFGKHITLSIIFQHPTALWNSTDKHNKHNKMFQTAAIIIIIFT
jgi:hypothetical protein